MGDFERSGFTHVPALQSRPLEFKPDLVKRRLYDLEIEQVEDPALENLFLGKRDEIMRQITLLEDRDTSRFMYESLQLFGDVGDALVIDANEVNASTHSFSTRSERTWSPTRTGERSL